MNKNDSRSFTAVLPKGLGLDPHSLKKRVNGTFQRSMGQYLFLYLTGLFIFLLFLTFFLYKIYKATSVVRSQEEKKLAYWENIIHEHPNYTDAYYKAAVSAIRLQEQDKARRYLAQALTLDPMFSQAEQLRGEIK